MRTLTILLLGLTFLSCNSTDSKSEHSSNEPKQSSEPNYKVAIQFINDYIDFSNDRQSEVGLIEWINQRHDVTVDFKNELNRILEQAEKNDPELGLGFDPILDAQNNPNRFELEKTESEYLIVKGENWPEFRLTLKMKLVDSKWLVDGAGIINVPENKRIKR
ncbi:hypothetical protein LB456_13455 [Psychroflexus sp. CAK57W]|uniref:hypothetical protein n=1 Tax=Psychroflexus curvus TaxID=2873595 RepID=UPI001CC958BF|nr:hypothetical protein [Psychroflexus curvus]MBZ9788467.1 hypothetical protein [Psychroflexus curvus]